MTTSELIDQFISEAGEDPRQAAIQLAKKMGEMWWFSLIPQGDKLAADIAGIVRELNDRWQAAVGTTLKDAERLASGENGSI